MVDVASLPPGNMVTLSTKAGQTVVGQVFGYDAAHGACACTLCAFASACARVCVCVCVCVRAIVCACV